MSKATATEWPIGCWDCRGWGAIRLLEDRYAIDLDPEGHLQNWGVWQWYDQHTVIVMWMESNMLEFIQKDGDKYMRQSLYSFGPGSSLEEVKKIGK